MKFIVRMFALLLFLVSLGRLRATDPRERIVSAAVALGAALILIMAVLDRGER